MQPCGYRRHPCADHRGAYLAETDLAQRYSAARFLGAQAAYRRAGAQPPRGRQRADRGARADYHPPDDRESLRAGDMGIRSLFGRRLLRQRALHPFRCRVGDVPRPRTNPLQNPRYERRELHRRLAYRAHLARPRHCLRPRGQEPSQPPEFCPCALCCDRHPAYAEAECRTDPRPFALHPA